MPVSSLFELAKQRLIRSIDLLTDVGDIPFSFLEPILHAIRVPEQLEGLEERCPQLRGETEDLWLKFIKRDIPNWDKKPHQPRDPRNWSKVYRKLKKDAEKEKQADAEVLKQQIQALQKDRGQNKTLIVDSKVGYGASSLSMYSSRGGGSSWGPPSGAPKQTGKVAFDKLRRGVFDHKRERPKVQKMPAHVLAQRQTKIHVAPARMVRMAEVEAAKPIVPGPDVLSLTERQASLPKIAIRPNILQKSVPVAKPIPARTSLPTGQQFHAPKPRPTPQSSSSTPKKKQREEYSLFHQPKRRKL